MSREKNVGGNVLEGLSEAGLLFTNGIVDIVTGAVGIPVDIGAVVFVIKDKMDNVDKASYKFAINNPTLSNLQRARKSSFARIFVGLTRVLHSVATVAATLTPVPYEMRRHFTALDNDGAHSLDVLPCQNYLNGNPFPNSRYNLVTVSMDADAEINRIGFFSSQARLGPATLSDFANGVEQQGNLSPRNDSNDDDNSDYEADNIVFPGSDYGFFAPPPHKNDSAFVSVDLRPGGLLQNANK